MVLASQYILVRSVYSAIIHFLYSDIILPKSKCRRIETRRNGSRRNSTKNLVDKTGVDEIHTNTCLRGQKCITQSSAD